MRRCKSRGRNAPTSVAGREVPDERLAAVVDGRLQAARTTNLLTDEEEINYAEPVSRP
jgi:hypothetical protein